MREKDPPRSAKSGLPRYEISTDPWCCGGPTLRAVARAAAAPASWKALGGGMNQEHCRPSRHAQCAVGTVLCPRVSTPHGARPAYGRCSARPTRSSGQIIRHPLWRERSWRFPTDPEKRWPLRRAFAGHKRRTVCRQISSGGHAPTQLPRTTAPTATPTSRRNDMASRASLVRTSHEPTSIFAPGCSVLKRLPGDVDG